MFGRSLFVRTAVVSDAVRFVILHKYGGMYIDADILLLRDLQPLYMHEFAYRWSTLDEFNTAVLRLHPRSSISAKLLDLAHIKQDPYIFYPTTIRSYLEPMVLTRLPAIFFDPLWLVADSADSKSSLIWKLTGSTRGVFETVFHEQSEFSQQGREVFNGAFAFHWHSLHRAGIFEEGSYLYQWNEFLRNELFNSNS
jgi:WD repeat and SOF domain-containing protein 1